MMNQYINEYLYNKNILFKISEIPFLNKIKINYFLKLINFKIYLLKINYLIIINNKLLFI